MNLKTSAAVFSVALLSAAQAGAVTLTFDDIAAGTLLSNQYAAQGATFSANAFTGPGSSTSGAAWGTNTDMTVVSSTGTDVGGLGTPPLVSGNLLHGFGGWLAEDGDASFRISFSTAVNAFSATFAGVTTGADVTIWAFNGATQVGLVSGTTQGQFVLNLTAPVITSVVIRPGSFNDWVGVDNVTFAPVPEVSTYAMMALGLGLLAFRRRQRG